MQSLFNGATAYTMFKEATSFNQPLAHFNTHKVTTMVGMFEGATSFSKNISCWNVLNIPSKPTAFNNASALSTPQLPNWGLDGSTGTCDTH